MQNAIENAKKTFAIELDALRGVAENLDIQFQQSIEAILAARGKLVVCGMGKSGHIGQKMAATFASTGTSSFFVHPGEAFHGDLGMIGKEDVVLLISFSGETDEVLRHHSLFNMYWKYHHLHEWKSKFYLGERR